MDLQFSSCQWPLLASGLLTGLIIFLVQIFFIVRIWKVRRSVYPDSPWTFVMSGVFTILALFAITTSIALNTISCRAGASGVDLVHTLLDANIAVETSLDVLLTVALVCLLNDHRNEFGDKSNSPIERLIVFFIARGVGVSVWQVFGFLGDVTLTNKSVWFAVAMCTASVYTCSVLATVNNRDRSRTKLCATPEEIVRELPTHLQFSPPEYMATNSAFSVIPSHQRPTHVRSQTTLSLPLHLRDLDSYETGSVISLPRSPTLNRPWLKQHSH
ncbi:hypothetical protein OF83DRAFT_467725 [Amylostereum chailletii]|nr:hypothetical protein OF83DRAFT_467725 [Amylostereum chailletii]